MATLKYKKTLKELITAKEYDLSILDSTRRELKWEIETLKDSLDTINQLKNK